jgi:hypothetical protein
MKRMIFGGTGPVGGGPEACKPLAAGWNLANISFI